MTGYQHGDGRVEPQRSQAKVPVTRSGYSPDKTNEGTPPRPKLLARLPNLDVTELDRVVESAAKPKKRSWTRRISTGILLGVGGLFLIVAINPNILGHREGAGGKPPAPNADEAPAYAPSSAQTSPAGSPASPNMPSIPVSIPALPPSIPDVPESIMGPAAGGGKQDSPSLPPINTQGSWAPSAPAINTPAAGVSVQGPVASYPVTSYPATSYPVTPASASRPIATPNPSYYDSRGASPGSVNQPMNLSGPAPAMTVPGGARFDGVIEKTTERPSYDHVRPSLR